MTARLALIGAPGAGKSTIGAELSQRWDSPFIDSDDVYEVTYGHSVAEAVIDDEAAFRERETAVVLQSLSTPGAIVAVGSGAVGAQAVRAELEAIPTVWLEVGLVDAARRTGLSGTRPVAMGNIRGQFATMLEERAALYASVADLRIATDARPIDDIITEIAEWEAGL